MLETTEVLWTPRADRNLFRVMTSVLADYYNESRTPLSRFDIAHLIDLHLGMNSPAAGVVISFHGGEAVGVVCIEEVEPRPTRPYRYEITRLYVREPFRGKGVSKALMESAARRLMAASETHAFLIAPAAAFPANALYTNLGFTLHPGAQEASDDLGQQGLLHLHAPIESILRAASREADDPVVAEG